jgi:anti-anti-sigma factor
METIRVSSVRTDDVIRVSVAGELDIGSAPKVEDELKRVEGQRPDMILIDLRELEFMDSTGLRAILSADARARDQGIRLVVVQGSDNIRRVFEVTRIYDRVEVVNDPSEVQ